jgi:excisionase family DNA binding protein
MPMTNRAVEPGARLIPQVGRSVSIDDAARLLGVSRRTIYTRIRDGRLETVRTLGGSRRVVLESLLSQKSRSDIKG